MINLNLPEHVIVEDECYAGIVNIWADLILLDSPFTAHNRDSGSRFDTIEKIVSRFWKPGDKRWNFLYKVT